MIEQNQSLIASANKLKKIIKQKNQSGMDGSAADCNALAEAQVKQFAVNNANKKRRNSSPVSTRLAAITLPAGSATKSK